MGVIQRGTVIAIRDASDASAMTQGRSRRYAPLPSPRLMVLARILGGTQSAVTAAAGIALTSRGIRAPADRAARSTVLAHVWRKPPSPADEARPARRW